MRWIKRRSHARRLPSGGVAQVRASWVLRYSEPARRGGSYRHPCPDCGAQIISVNMPNKGWVHFEGGAGLGRVKHPCLHRGEGLSRARDELTGDLFDDLQNSDGDS